MLNWKDIVNRMFVLYEVKTQTALSEKIEVEQTLISRWMRSTTSRPSWDTLEKIVAEKNVTWDWLLEGREPKYRENT